ncbi:MAG: glycerol-3-phosphate 1-O-acyltransferase PlsY [Bacteroidia bacterium]|nr:glycerol-3-phosphate 1-O-acyltransferase PlsY [Bacteroidia bacterium]MDW8014496.1 glycerol-3-phosphate 1-O-acyltransferase PlsY [Bacteroidia bacterium]
MEVALSLISAYLLGSLTPGLWLARWQGIDIRQKGSGNIGSTNVYRVMGFWAGLLVQVIDIGKGMLAILLGKSLRLSEPALYGAATAAVLGHIYPIFARFKGGKGINTLLGTMVIIEPLSAVAATGTFLLVLALTQIVSVSSLIAVGSFLLWHGIVGEDTSWGYLTGTVWWVGVIYTHRENLGRLWKGEELQIGQKLP